MAGALAALLGAVPAAHAAFPGLNGKIAYEKSGEIWVKDEGAGNDQQLTDQGGDPAWSPDGTRIAFTSDRNGTAGDIWVMNADGSGQTRLTTSNVNEGEPAWSPGGTRIIFRGFGDATSQLVVMNANGSGPAPLTQNADINAAPAWSPGGDRIAWRHFAGGTGISVMNADGSSPVQTVPNASRPNWFPDSSRLVFDRSLGADVWSAAPDGSGLVQLTDDPASDFDPAVSPDGSRIAFSSSRDGNFEIYVMFSDGAVEIRNTLTAAGIQDTDPDWQPLGPPPDIASLSRPVAGSPGATLTVDGAGFVLRSVVRWNGADRPTTFAGPTRLTAALSTADVASAGTAQVTVFTPPAGGGLSLPRTAVIDPAPPSPPPPRITLRSAAISATWARSRVVGSLRLRGAAERAGRVEIPCYAGRGCCSGAPPRSRAARSPAPCAWPAPSCPAHCASACARSDRRPAPA